MAVETFDHGQGFHSNPSCIKSFLVELDERGVTHKRLHAQGTAKPSGAAGGECVVWTG